MNLDRAVAAAWVGMISFGAGMTTIAQGVLTPDASTVERWVGGGTLVAVAILIVHWSRQMGKDIRETLTTSLTKVQATLDQTIEILDKERDAWGSERASLADERAQLRQELVEVYAHLKEERNLRISLERAGVTERRTDGDARPPEGDDLG